LVKLLGSVLVVAAIAGAIALSARAPAVREIRIVARDMTFYVDGQVEPNPTLRLRPGEAVRLVLRNEDGGMTHDFAIPEWGAVTKRIESGEEAAITFRAPDGPASGSYQCRPHAAYMRGTILVE
jgi:plastocyanin